MVQHGGKQEGRKETGKRAGEGEKELWLTFGQWRRGAVAFGSWLWRVHNAYCRATHRTNVCANASTQRATAAPPPLLVPLFLLNGHARRHPFSHHLFHPYDFFATSLAFGKGNKIAPLEKEEEEEEEGRYRVSSLSIYLSFSKEMSPSRGSKNDARRILDTSCRILHAKGDGGKPFRRFKRRL